MQRPPRKPKVVETTVQSDNRDIIKSDTQKLLIIQREGNFTYRCIDCLHEPKVFLRSCFLPCIAHAENTAELGMEKSSTWHKLMCLLSPCFIGSYTSVGKSKIIYRKQNTIPGLPSDDYATSTVFPCCIIAQLRYELNAKKNEEKRVLDLQKELGIASTPEDQAISRN